MRILKLSRQKVLQSIALLLVFLFSFLFFLILTFPRESFWKRAFYEMEKSLAIRIDAERMVFSFPVRFSATGVAIRSVDQRDGLYIPLQNVSGNISLFGLISGKIMMNLYAKGSQGKAEASFTRSSEHRLYIKLNDVNIEQVPKPASFPSVQGKLNGSANFSWLDDITKSDGKGSISISSLVFKSFPSINFFENVPVDEVTADLFLTGGRLELRGIIMKKEPFVIKGSGWIRPINPPAQSPLELSLNIPTNHDHPLISALLLVDSDLKIKPLANVYITGTISNPVVLVNGKRLSEIKGAKEEKQMQESSEKIDQPASVEEKTEGIRSISPEMERALIERKLKREEEKEKKRGATGRKRKERPKIEYLRKRLQELSR